MNTNSFITQDIISILKDAQIDMPAYDPDRIDKLEQENERLRKQVAKQALEIRMLREQTLGNW